MASAVEVWLGGEYVPPDTVRDAIMGEGGHGYTTFSQLAAWLRSRGLRTEHHWGSDLLADFHEAYAAQDVVIALFRWRLEEPYSGHFMAVTGVTPGGDLILHDPWTGMRRTMGAANWSQWWKGEWMIVRKGT